MSFFSIIRLAANRGDLSIVRSERILEIAHECELISSRTAIYENAYPLACWLSRIFHTPGRLRENDLLFTPDALSVGEEIAGAGLESPHVAATKGIAISFHGNGYFHPLTRTDIISDWCGNKHLAAFRRRISAEYACAFRPPMMMRNYFAPFLLTTDPGWVWITCETG